MNEIDEELTLRKLATRIVFICYVDTTWAPEEETIKNPDRFSLLVAAISRDYSQRVDSNIDFSKIELRPFNLNHNVLPKTVNEYIKHGKLWRERCRVPAFVYEYHFWWPQYHDLGLFDFAKLISDDIRGYAANGHRGIVEDASQRSFFPNGLCFHTYAETLFDLSRDAESIQEDVLSHAYGEEWQTVRELFRELGEAVDYRYLMGSLKKEGGLSVYYNPDLIKNFMKVHAIVEKYRPFVKAHKVMPYRPQIISYRILEKYLDYCDALAECLILKAEGKNKAAMEKFDPWCREFGKYELEYEGIYDHTNCYRSWLRLFGDVKNPTV